MFSLPSMRGTVIVVVDIFARLFGAEEEGDEVGEQEPMVELGRLPSDMLGSKE